MATYFGNCVNSTHFGRNCYSTEFISPVFHLEHCAMSGLVLTLIAVTVAAYLKVQHMLKISLLSEWLPLQFPE